MSSDSKPVKLKDFFDELDTNKDGVLSFAEAQFALTGKVAPAEYRAIFDKFDADGNGTLDLQEFTKLCRALDAAKFEMSGNMVRQKSNSLVDQAYEAREAAAMQKKVAAGVAVALAIAAFVYMRRK